MTKSPFCCGAFLLLAAVLLLCMPAASSSAQPAFSDLVNQYLSESEHNDPLFADSIGIHTYDDRLPDYTPSGVEAGYRWEKSWRARFAALDSATLSLGERADQRALIDSIDSDLLESRTLRPYANDPTIYVNAIGTAAYYITSRNYAPLETRMAALAKRLRRVPDLVRAAESSLEHPTKVSTELAIAQNRGNIDMYGKP